MEAMVERRLKRIRGLIWEARWGRVGRRFLGSGAGSSSFFFLRESYTGLAALARVLVRSKFGESQ